VDSGNISAQCVDYTVAMREAAIRPDRVIVFEDEVTPEGIVKVYSFYREKTGEEPVLLFPGAGGYWWKLVHRDTLSAAFKRSWTNGQPNIKFSNSEGKESDPGIIRVYGRGETLYIAHVTDKVDGEPLYQKLVSKGRIVYNESEQVQAQRADKTWGKYTRIEYSPTIEHFKTVYREKRRIERAAARAALESRKGA
jgi:nicotinic acid phosphoribosyltransferase